MNNIEYFILKPREDDQHRDGEADQTLPTDPQFLHQIQEMCLHFCIHYNWSVLVVFTFSKGKKHLQFVPLAHALRPVIISSIVSSNLC